jgi:hypothetical protein
MAVKDAHSETSRLQSWLEWITWEGNSSHIESEWANAALHGAEPPRPAVQSIRA